MTTNNASGRTMVKCRFCGRLPVQGLPRAPGPVGPICADCLTAGLTLIRRGPTGEPAALAALASSSEVVCEYCGRWERRTFLGRHKSLKRLTGGAEHAVICADCLDRGGDLINRAARR